MTSGTHGTGHTEEKNKQKEVRTKHWLSKYDPSMCDTVVKMMEQGFSKKSVAAELGIDDATIWRWGKKYQEFGNAIKKGERLQYKFFEFVGMSGMVGKIPGFNTVAWIFFMKNHFNWMDKNTTELTGKDGQPIQLVAGMLHKEQTRQLKEDSENVKKLHTTGQKIQSSEAGSQLTNTARG